MSIKSRHRNRADAIHVRRAVVVRIAVVVDIGDVTRPVGLWQFALCGGHPVSRGLDKGYQFPGGLFADLADLGLGDCRGRVVSRLASDPDHAR